MELNNILNLTWKGPSVVVCLRVALAIGHHCVEKQGTLKETPVGSPRDAFYTFKDLYRYTTGC